MQMCVGVYVNSSHGAKQHKIYVGVVEGWRWYVEVFGLLVLTHSLVHWVQNVPPLIRELIGIWKQLMGKNEFLKCQTY